ncbi:MAG: ATP-binding cassette domain-containing protein [Rhodospirillaceae bacterium]|nr:ATP-binding cassette domain-containing protein [Rhodospirillaceae bacterium]
MIEVNSLSKVFGDVSALSDVSFRARDGVITGLLGPNGAGKSTCLRILSSVLRPSHGAASVGGIDISDDPLAVRRIIGTLPHGAGLYPHLTAVENIRYFGLLCGVDRATLSKRIDRLVQQLDLGDVANRKAGGFSQGERTKVALARAIVHEPPHLLLDEPTNGLDVMAVRQLRKWLQELAREGRCILISSHVMQEISALADDLVIIAHGRIAAKGTPEELADRFGKLDLEEIFVSAVGGESS